MPRHACGQGCPRSGVAHLNLYKLSHPFERDFDFYFNVLGADHVGYIPRLKAAVSALSDGNAAFDRSAEQAVRRVGKFEVPADNTIFERHFRKVYLLFQPEDLLR